MDADYDEDMPEEGTKGRRIKGRGGQDPEHESRYKGQSGVFESLPGDAEEGPARSIEGWVVIVSGVHEEAQEDDVFEAFAEYGDIKNLHLNLDRRTGFVKGYSFIEYGAKSEAESAIKGMNGTMLLDSKLSVDWAFTRGGGGKSSRRR
eukprot:gnl/TRDRNA2_/TRDRNA2_180018_c0_seq1.p1 gnl/TRDRNA2_/TRDRNA2_180018_c0~~gnl/TRDRNA2_/TRDRNA2_180018_c0_seq1.p1  ORF type:complete len:148 (-),score=38.05 gnl/TRDRNA2_/TRDRNA2_180018_c0_seq1:97-540(-)